MHSRDATATSLIQWGPIDDLSTLRESMDELCEVPYTRRWCGRALAAGQPPVDIFEMEHDVIVLAELPNIDLEDVEIKVTDNTLTIKGEAKRAHGNRYGRYHRRELRYGSFVRSLALPYTVKGDQVTASYKDGILEIRVPKRKPPKSKIEVTAA